MPEPEFSILGPLTARLAPDGDSVALGEQVRLLLGRLLIEPGAVVSTDALADALWEEEPRADRRNGVQAAVKAARRALGDHARRTIVRVGDGYRLAVNPLRVDAERFKLLAVRGNDLAGDLPRAARAMLVEALAAWRGPLLGDHGERSWAAGHARELDCMRDNVERDLNEVRLALGEHAMLDAALRKQVVDRPTDERRRAQLVRALDGAGRAAEAGLAYRDAYRELGTLGPELRALGDRIGRGLPAQGARPAPVVRPATGSEMLLCAVASPADARSGERGIGTLSVVVDWHGGAPHPVDAARLVATFDEPTEALRAARAIAADDRLRAAVGIHAGGIVQLGDRLAGSGPARCWQLAAAAHPGQILVSAAARARVGEAGELRDLGVQVFDDLAPGEPLYELRGDEDAVRPPRTLSTTSHNLPVQTTRFVGRDAELGRLSRLVAGGELLTLVGAGGCGKTRLALQLAARCATRFADGAWFVGLAGLEVGAGVHDVAATVAARLGIRLTSGEPTAALMRHLSGRAAVLVLDNCEHVHEPCGALVARLRVECPRVCVVATSRRALRVDGERLAPVPPMLTDGGRGPGTLPDAVELLLERAGPLPGDVASDPDGLRDANRICRALDGLPLAIELAAGHVTTRGLAGVAVEVEAMMSGERSLDLFVAQDPGRHPRQRTIEATIDWSYRLLDPRAQRVLRRLAVFRGTFGLAEARCVVCDDDIDAGAVAGVVARLVEHSTLAAAAPLAGATRLRLVEPIRAFALAELDRAGELEAVRAAHARTYAALARAVAPQMFGPAEQTCLDRLEADHDNLRAALSWLVEQEQAEEALGLVGSLWWLWYLHGHFAEGSARVQQALALDGPASQRRVRALRAGAHLAWYLGDFALATACNVALEACAREIDDAWGLAWAPMAHGAIELFRDPRKALPLFEESKRRFDELGHEWEAGYALQVIGGALWFTGQEQAGRDAFEAAVAVFERLGHPSVLASVQRAAGLMAARCGDPARGVALCRSALVASMAIDDRAGSAQALNFLAATSRAEGDLDAAGARYADALKHAHAIGDAWATCWALDGVASIACDLGEAELAARLLAAARTLAGQARYMQSPRERDVHERDIGRMREQLGDADYARAIGEGELIGVGEAVSSALAFAGRLMPASGSAAPSTADR